MVILCDVQYETPRIVHVPGDVISGCVLLTLEERVLMKALYLKFSGYAATRWEKTEKHKGKPPPIYTNREDYISTLNYFIGSDEALPKIVERGRYSYNFAVRLPEKCPSSFESDVGHVRYELQVFMDLPERQHSCYARTLAVRKEYDLRSDMALARTLDVEQRERTSFFKFWLQPLQLQVNLPQTGYIPGENVSVYVKVLNHSQLIVRDIIYKLIMIGTYTALDKKKTIVKVVRNTLQEKVHSMLGAPHDEVLQHLDMLQVPQTATTTLISDCHCIRIAYEVEVLVTTTKKKRFVQAQLPIVIGSISLRSNLRRMPAEVTGSAPTLCAAPLPQNDTFTVSPLRTDADVFKSSTNLQKTAALSRSAEVLDEKRKYLYDDIEASTSGTQAAVIVHQPPSYNEISEQKKPATSTITNTTPTYNSKAEEAAASAAVHTISTEASTSTSASASTSASSTDSSSEPSPSVMPMSAAAATQKSIAEEAAAVVRNYHKVAEAGVPLTKEQEANASGNNIKENGI